MAALGMLQPQHTLFLRPVKSHVFCYFLFIISDDCICFTCIVFFPCVISVQHPQCLSVSLPPSPVPPFSNHSRCLLLSVISVSLNSVSLCSLLIRPCLFLPLSWGFFFSLLFCFLYDKLVHLFYLSIQVF